MARILVTCPQSGNTDYVNLFSEWSKEMENRWYEANKWIQDNNRYLSIKKSNLSYSLSSIETFRDTFRVHIGGWVNDIKTWLTNTKKWLEDCKVIVSDMEGDMDVITEWQEWLDQMEIWVNSVSDWYTSVEVMLTEIVINFNNAKTEWQNANDSYTQMMNSWLLEWPLGLSAV